VQANSNESVLAPTVIIGAGFSGLSAALELATSGQRVIILEAEDRVGGLAASFDTPGYPLECFYHHWFNNDRYISQLIAKLGAEDRVKRQATPTGMYYAKRFYRLASPLDVLRFKPLSFWNRLRLGALVVVARMHKDAAALDKIPAKAWIKKIAGEQVYATVWEPLLKGKFGRHADDISAAWFWAKLVLRGGSRGKGAKEELMYFEGGFAALAELMVEKICENGGEVRLNSRCVGLECDANQVKSVQLESGASVTCSVAVLTTALPITTNLLGPFVSAEYVGKLGRIEYLANVCLVLQLDRSLGELYWVNVNDVEFPFVGVIEHTNFEPPESYGGRHIVYLSRYLPPEDVIFQMSATELMDFAYSHICKMFPEFEREWILDYHVWKATYAQPVVTCGYLDHVPERDTPLENLKIVSMAQIYPEDRGTNYAVRDGQACAESILAVKD